MPYFLEFFPSNASVSIYPRSETVLTIVFRVLSSETYPKLAPDAPGSPKEKKSTEKRRLKKSESSEKRRLKSRKSSKNKEKENAATASTTAHTRSDSGSNAPRELVDEQESLAFDSSDEVKPLQENTGESDEGSLATSTTHILGLGKTDLSSVDARRATFHLGSAGAINRLLDEMAERERQEDMETLSQIESRTVASRRSGTLFSAKEENNGSDESDDGEVTWKSTTAVARKRPSSGFYDGFSSAHSSDSEGMKRRSYLKPRPVTDRVPLGDRSPSGEARGTSPTFRATSVDDRIKINVGGRIFETYVSTLRKYPHTLLGTMLHPRNAHMLGNKNKTSTDGKPLPDTELFFDRNPRMFEIILDFYRTSAIHRPPDVSWEMLQEELSFFQIDLPEYTNLSKRVSIELRKLEYKDLILPASEYRKMTRVKLLKEHHTSIVRILDFIQQKVQRKADAGHNTSTITFYSPLHYTNSTPREIFKVISTNEIRELLVELLRSKDFQVKETNEYSKTKTTSIIGLHDQIINYNDPQYFSFHIKW